MTVQEFTQVLLATSCAPDWLCREAAYERFGRGKAGLRKFDEFVHERIPAKIRSVLETKRWKPVVGDEEFEEKWDDRVRKSAVDRQREVAEARRLIAVRVEDVVRRACEVLRIEPGALVDGRRGSANVPRDLTMRACRERTAADNRQIGSRFNVAAATMSTAVRRARSRLGVDRKAMKPRQKLERSLAKK